MGNRPTAEQRAAADALIDALNLAPSEENGFKEPLRPKDVFNPKLQRTYQCIQHRALQNAGEPNTLPPPSVRISQPFQPQKALFSGASEAISRFATAFPLTPCPPERRKRGSLDLGGGEKRTKQESIASGAGASLQLHGSSVEQVNVAFTSPAIASLPSCHHPFPHRIIHCFFN